MDFTFTNGTGQQQSLVTEATTRLLNLDLDLVPINVTVTFAGSTGHTDGNRFAFSTLTGVNAALTIRDDFPLFSDTLTDGFDAGRHRRFAREVVARELGRIIISSLPAVARSTLAGMFDTEVADWNNGAWADRPFEGIVETFKAAFLPQPLRVFHNRTARQIPLPKYREFRATIRGQTSFGEESFGQHSVSTSHSGFIRYEGGGLGFQTPGNLWLMYRSSSTSSYTQTWDSDYDELFAQLSSQFGLAPSLLTATNPEYEGPINSPVHAVLSASLTDPGKLHLAARRDRGMPLPATLTTGFGPRVLGYQSGTTASTFGFAFSLRSMPHVYAFNIIERHASSALTTPWLSPLDMDDLLPIGSVITFKHEMEVRGLWVLDDESYGLGQPALRTYDLPFEVKEYVPQADSHSSYPGVVGNIPWNAPNNIRFEYVGSDPPRGPEGSDPSLKFWPQAHVSNIGVPIPAAATDLVALIVSFRRNEVHQYPKESPRFPDAWSLPRSLCRQPGAYWVSDALSFPGYLRNMQSTQIRQEQARVRSTLPAETLPSLPGGGIVIPAASIMASAGTHGARVEHRRVIGTQ